jgi:anti-sigma regulatory factor (Ser/Thr protein kinase)
LDTKQIQEQVAVDLERLIGTESTDLVFSVDPAKGQLGFVRYQVHRFLEERGIDDDIWPLIATELVANAIDATATGDATTIRLSVDTERSRVQLVVANVGPLYQIPESGSPPPATAVRGRGLYLVRALVDDINVHHVDGATITTCWRAIEAGPKP